MTGKVPAVKKEEAMGGVALLGAFLPDYPRCPTWSCRVTFPASLLVCP